MGAQIDADLRRRRRIVLRQPVDIDGKNRDLVMMRLIAERWTRAAIAYFPKIVDRLLQFGVLRGAVRKLR